MACPFFRPVSPLAGFAPESTPLGDLFDGRCGADAELRIPVEMLRGCCNPGYARGKCGLAAQADADAVRFLIRSHGDGITQVVWSMERNHHPIAVGSARADEPETGNEALDAQIRAYAEACLRHTLP